MGKRKKRSLKRKLTASMVIFALMLVLAIGILVCARYFDYRMNGYEVSAFEYSRTAADIIDGDKIRGYLETGEKDEHYYDVLRYLDSAQRETQIKYYYVVAPQDDEFIYIWDADNKDDADDPQGYELGYREKYSGDDEKAALLRVMCKDPPEKVLFTWEDNYGAVATAYSPIFNSAGEAVAVAAVDLSTAGMVSAILQFVSMLLLTVLSITAVAVIILYANLNKRLINPIGKLTKSAGETVENLEKDDVANLDIRTGDEIEDLADAFTKMDVDLKEYIKELADATAEKERISAELNVAAHIQEDMLPREFPERDEFDLYATMDPAREVGGDFYDFFMVDDDHIALVMADVAGKGIPAALFMVVSKIFIKNCMQSGMSPAEALERVNNQLLENNNTGLFVTVWLAVIDLRTGKGVAANAGHMHPGLRRSGCCYELIKYRHSPAVATIEGISFKEHEFELYPGDSLFVYTDGVTEATNSAEKLFGEGNMLDTLNGSSITAPKALLSLVKQAIDVFVGDAPQFDDITMLVFNYKGGVQAREKPI